MRRSLAAILLLVSCTTAKTPPQTSSAQLARIADDYWQHQLAEDVSLQIKFGIPTERLPDPSFAHAQKAAGDARSMLAKLDEIDPATLTEDERTTLRILRWKANLTIESLQHFWLQSFITPYATEIRTINQLFTQPNPRLVSEYGRYLDAMTAIVTEQRRRGILIPKPELPAVRTLIGAIPVQLPRRTRPASRNIPAARTRTASPSRHKHRSLLRRRTFINSGCTKSRASTASSTRSDSRWASTERSPNSGAT